MHFVRPGLFVTLLALLLVPLQAIVDSQHAATDKEVMLDETFSVREGATLRLGLNDAHVRIETGHKSPARVRITLEADDMDEARDFYDQRNFRVRSERGGLAITSESVNLDGGWFDGDPTGGAQIRVYVTLPTRFDLAGHTDDGDVVLDGPLEGAVDLRTDDGALEFDSVTGPSIALRTEDGDARATELTADEITWEADDGDLDVEAMTAKQRIRLRTEDGDLTLGDVSGPEIDLASDDGDVRIRQLAGRLTASLSDGDVEIDRIAGASVEVQSDDGGITIGHLAAATSRLQAEDGEIRIGSLDGALDAQTEDGSIEVSLTAAHPLTLRTDDSTIRLTLPASLAITLDLDGEDIDLDDVLRAPSLTVDEEFVTGALNGGGPTLNVRSDGNIQVLSQ
jgi:DUF4097 and DUF4098 domain-containing protein YvlB